MCVGMMVLVMMRRRRCVVGRLSGVGCFIFSSILLQTSGSRLHFNCTPVVLVLVVVLSTQILFFFSFFRAYMFLIGISHCIAFQLTRHTTLYLTVYFFGPVYARVLFGHRTTRTRPCRKAMIHLLSQMGGGMTPSDSSIGLSNAQGASFDMYFITNGFSITETHTVSMLLTSM